MPNEVSERRGGKAKRVKCNIDLILYEEETLHYVYSPALDLIGYGKTTEEALQSWEVAMEEYVRYGLENNTLIKDLQNHGWSIEKQQNQLQPPTFSWLLQHNDQLSEVYDKHSFQKTSTAISVPLQTTFA